MTTFADFAKTVLEERDQDGIRGVASERNRYALHVATSAFADKELDAIAAVDIREWLRVMSRKNAADTRGERLICADTIKRSFALVSSIFTAACERDLLKVSPTHGVKVKKRSDERATKEKWAFLTLDEQKAIAGCKDVSLADRLTVRFAIATGLRQGEQFNLELTDVHTGIDNPRVIVRYGSFKRGKGKLPPKSGKIRTVPLFGDGLVAAREWLYVLPTYAADNPQRLVFPSPHGTRRGVGKPLGRGDAFKRVLRAAGIERHVRWHDLRHTFCSNLVSGVLGRRWTLEEVRPLAGHSSITITQRYSHISERELVLAAEATAFTHGPSIVPTAPDTDLDVSQWDEEAVAS